MNNRGKKLSDLELLKNRLIYLTTLYTNDEIEIDERKELRSAINYAWREVYSQLGRNEKHPLNDDDFLKAHWIMYFQYSRYQGNDYIKFLLEEKFSPRNIHKNVEREISLNIPEEQRSDFDIIDNDEDEDANVESFTTSTAKLQPTEIQEYVSSLKESAVHWFNTHFPYLASELSPDVQDAIDKLNRLGMGYFRPLVMSILKNESKPEKITDILNQIERFVFISFRLSQKRSNYRDSEFYNASREYDSHQLTLDALKLRLEQRLSFAFDPDGKYNSANFYNYLLDKFTQGNGNGYYDWIGIRYFLYEYELHLTRQSGHKKVSWDDLIQSTRDKISIEHIFPQSPTDDWKSVFSDIEDESFSYYIGSIGNLLILSMSINSSLQNDIFEDKKRIGATSTSNKSRKGYSNGSHSEIEVSQHKEWTSESIRKRGMELLTFMEERWQFKFKSEEEKERLLFLDP